MNTELFYHICKTLTERPDIAAFFRALLDLPEDRRAQAIEATRAKLEELATR